jgi:hypothetical protein
VIGGGIDLSCQRGYEFFSVIEFNPIPSEREIPKIHGIPQKEVYL